MPLKYRQTTPNADDADDADDEEDEVKALADVQDEDEDQEQAPADVSSGREGGSAGTDPPAVELSG